MQAGHVTELVPAATEGRAEFTTIDLTIDLDQAEDIIRSTIEGLTACSTEEGRKFRSPDGMLVALIKEGDPTIDALASRVVYRTAPASDLSTLKATKIYRALRPYQV